MKGTTIFTILMLIGLALMVLGVTYMPGGHEPIKFAWCKPRPLRKRHLRHIARTWHNSRNKWGFKIMKSYILLALLTLGLSSCASLQYAGNASYSVSPYESKTGEVSCCKVDVHNGKEIANLEAHIIKDGDKYTVDLKEQGVAAFAGQEIAAGATKDFIEATARAAAMTALAPFLPSLVPVVGAALASPGIGAAAVGAGTVIAVEKLTPGTSK